MALLLKLNMTPLTITSRATRRKRSAVIVVACVLLVGALGVGPTPQAQEKPAPAAAEDSDQTLTTRLKPILQKYCFECHSGKKAKGNLSLDSLAADFMKADTATAWEKVGERLEANSMPPKSKPQPSREESAAMRKLDRSGGWCGPMRRGNGRKAGRSIGV